MRKTGAPGTSSHPRWEQWAAQLVVDGEVRPAAAVGGSRALRVVLLVPGAGAVVQPDKAAAVVDGAEAPQAPVEGGGAAAAGGGAPASSRTAGTCNPEVRFTRWGCD